MSALVEANDDNVSLDVHHLASTISVPYEDPGDLTARAASATQALIGSLFELPATRSSVGPIAKLPPATTALPREKPCPEKKAETKWDKFAKEKGIQKKKKGRMEWDDERDKWAPTWGYDRAGSALDDAPIVEREKNEQRAKRARNGGRDADGDRLAAPKASDLIKAAAARAKADPDAPEGLPVDMTRKTHKGAKGVAGALARAQLATASLGNFDAMLDGEQARPSGEAKGRKRKFKAVAGPAGADADRGMAVMRDLEAPRAQKPKKGAKEVMDTHDGELPNGQSFKRKKGRAGAGKMKKVTKARGK
ncbi:hypothetical protein JL720_12360 [Aureococcus anophagefferens]|nr:hypothetical protein JL720_12360 [Aureococcus anophagefferens]